MFVVHGKPLVEYVSRYTRQKKKRKTDVIANTERMRCGKPSAYQQRVYRELCDYIKANDKPPPCESQLGRWIYCAFGLTPYGASLDESLKRAMGGVLVASG